MDKLVVGNLKMNILSPSERERYFEMFKKEMEKKELLKTEIVLCPSAIHIDVFKKELGNKVKVGAQNIFWERQGSYTGEISPAMAKNFGSEFTIVGHSERRKYFGENNKMVNGKIMAALKEGLKVIMCIGETKLEKQSNQTMKVLATQIKEGLFGVSRVKSENVTIAYEPVWAVGTDAVPSSNDIMEAKILIRKVLLGIFDKRHAEKIKILYGGSVSSFTVKQVCLDSAMDGALIGRESLIPKEFIKIAQIING